MSAVVPLVALLAVLAATPGGSHASSEFMPPWGYALTAFGVVLLGLAVLWAFRGVGKRH